MFNQFETELYEFVNSDRVRINNHSFGDERKGNLDVWIEVSDRGERFLSQINVEGETYTIRKEIYTTKCYILREKATGLYWFLDKNNCGFWLQNKRFSGAKTFSGEESIKIQKWLADATRLEAPAAVRG